MYLFQLVCRSFYFYLFIFLCTMKFPQSVTFLPCYEYCQQTKKKYQVSLTSCRLESSFGRIDIKRKKMQHTSICLSKCNFKMHIVQSLYCIRNQSDFCSSPHLLLVVVFSFSSFSIFKNVIKLHYQKNKKNWADFFLSLSHVMACNFSVYY